MRSNDEDFNKDAAAFEVFNILLNMNCVKYYTAPVVACTAFNYICTWLLSSIFLSDVVKP